MGNGSRATAQWQTNATRQPQSSSHCGRPDLSVQSTCSNLQARVLSTCAVVLRNNRVSA